MDEEDWIIAVGRSVALLIVEVLLWLLNEEGAVELK